MKIYSWNVNGLRAVIRKGALAEFLNSEKPDILCMQEIKAKKDQVEIDLPDYIEYWNPAELWHCHLHQKYRPRDRKHKT